MEAILERDWREWRTSRISLSAFGGDEFLSGRTKVKETNYSRTKVALVDDDLK